MSDNGQQKQYNTRKSDASTRSNYRSSEANNKVYSLKHEEVLSFYRSVEAPEATEATKYHLKYHNCMCSLSDSRSDHRSDKHKRIIH